MSVAGAAGAADAQLRMRDLSYSQQYDLLFQGDLDTKKVRRRPRVRALTAHSRSQASAGTRTPRVWTRAAQAPLHHALAAGRCRCTDPLSPPGQAVPKPSPEAQAREDGARKVWLSDVFATAKSPPLAQRGLQKKDWEYAAFMAVIHGLCLLAPATFSWPMVGLFFVSYFITGARPHLVQGRSVPHSIIEPRVIHLVAADRQASAHRAPSAAGAHALTVLFARRLPGHHAQLPPAAEPPQLRHAQVAGVRAGVLRRAGGAGRPDRVGVQPPLPPPAH